MQHVVLSQPYQGTNIEHLKDQDIWKHTHSIPQKTTTVPYENLPQSRLLLSFQTTLRVLQQAGFFRRKRQKSPASTGFWSYSSWILNDFGSWKKIPLFHLVESTSSNLRFLIFCSSWIWGSKPQHMSFIEICWDGIRFTSILIRFNKDILNNSSQTNHLRFLRSGKCRAGFEFFLGEMIFVDSTLIFHFILTSFASIPWIFAILHGHHLISTLGSRLRSPLSSLATWSRGMDCCPMAESSMWHVHVCFCCTQSSNHLEKPHLKVEHHENVMKSCDLKVFSSRNSLCAWGGRPNSPPFRSTILGRSLTNLLPSTFEFFQHPTLWLPSQQLEFLIDLFWILIATRLFRAPWSFLTNPLQLVWVKLWQLSSAELPQPPGWIFDSVKFNQSTARREEDVKVSFGIKACK